MIFALLLLAATPDVPRDAPGTWADPARGVHLVPGARTLLSGFSVVSFDGLPFDDTTYWYDGVKVELPAHAFFGPTTLHPAWVEGVHVGDTVDSVERGRSLGRSVELLPRSAPKQGARGVARLDLLQVGLFAELTTEGPGTEIQLAGRFFAIPALVASFLDIRALLADWQLRVRQPIGHSAEVRLLLLGAFDNVALTVSGIPIEARLQSHQLDVRYRGDARGTFEAAGFLTSESVGITLAGNHTRNAIDGLEQAAGLRLAARPKLSDSAELSLGAELSLHRVLLQRQADTTLPDVGGDGGGTARAVEKRDFGLPILAGAHAELGIEEGAWTWRLGARADVWKPGDAAAFVTFDPRVRVSRDAGGVLTFEAGAGMTHQPASWLVPVPVLDTASLRAGVQEAVQAELALSLRPVTGHVFRLRGFGAALLKTLELSPFDPDFLQEVSFATDALERQQGSGWAAGGELSWRFLDNGWLWAQAAYSLQASWRHQRITRFDDHGLPQGEVVTDVPWAYQQLHAWTAAGGVRTRNGWSLGVALTLQTGPPLAGGLFSQEQQPGTDSLTGAQKWVPKDRDRAGNASPWFRLDARVSKTWRPGRAEVELFLDVQTLSIWAQPTGTSYGSSEGELTQKSQSSVLPGPLPMLGIEARL